MWKKHFQNGFGDYSSGLFEQMVTNLISNHGCSDMDKLIEYHRQYEWGRPEKSVWSLCPQTHRPPQKQQKWAKCLVLFKKFSNYR